MKSILKKTMGVLLLLSSAPIACTVVDLLISDTPDPVMAIQHGFVLGVLVLISFGIGWYIGKAVSWCFK